MSLTRRDFLRLTATGALTGTLLGEDPAPGSRPPNILFIFTDQQTASALSCAGNTDVHTPNIDALAAAGVRCEQAYCTDPLCTPARASMFTGHLPQRMGIMHNVLAIPEPFKSRGMGWVFRNAGYETAYAGKWHLPKTTMDDGHGFDVLCGMDDELVTAKSIEFLGRNREKPFLLVSAFIEPHGICAVTRYPDPRLRIQRTWPDARAFDADFTDRCPALPPNFASADLRPQAVAERHANGSDQQPKERPKHFAPEEIVNASFSWSPDQLRHYRYAYGRLIAEVDARIGRVIAALREHGLDGNTVIIFASDHGEMLGAHGLTMKRYFYEEAVRVPFIVSWPGRIPGGRVVRDRLVSVGLDLLPTLCDFAGIAAPDGLPGSSLRPLLEGTPQEWRNELVLACEDPSGRMLHTGRYTYMAYDHGTNPEELFDLAVDPGQLRNLIVDPAHTGVVADCRARLAAWRQRFADPAPGH
jgi:arylsulfatase A-like enzyme